MLIIRKEAEEDIESAFRWYEQQHVNLGVRFVEEIELKFQEIEKYPALHMEMMGNVRRALCNRFPYSIYFIKKNMDVVVLAVLHQRRNPAVWQSRKNAEQGN